jgi:hypothetical protein
MASSRFVFLPAEGVARRAPGVQGRVHAIKQTRSVLHTEAQSGGGGRGCLKSVRFRTLLFTDA